MKLIFTLIYVTSLAALTACGTSNGMKDKQQEPAIELSISTFEAQDIFPGVFSNLKKTRNYVVKGSGTFSEPGTVAFLLVDSIKLPIRFISVDGAKLKSPQEQISGEVQELVCHAGRNYYNEEAPQTYEADDYLSAGMETNGKAFLEISTSSGTEYIALPELTMLQPVYAP